MNQPRFWAWSIPFCLAQVLYMQVGHADAFRIEGATVTPGTGDKVIASFGLPTGTGLGTQLEDQLNTKIQELSTQLTTTVNTQINKLHITPFLKATANATSLASRGVAMDYATNPDLFSP